MGHTCHSSPPPARPQTHGLNHAGRHRATNRLGTDSVAGHALKTPHTTQAHAPSTTARAAAACAHTAQRSWTPTRVVRTAAAVETEAQQAASPAQLTGDAAAAWQAALAELQECVEGMSDAEAAEKLLRKAFGWTTQAFWRGSLVEAVPRAGQVREVVAYLQSLGVSGANLTKVIQKFPEVLACSIPDQLQVAVGKLQGEWRLQGDVLTRALVRQPQVLGYSVDCEGSCIGECNRCWARF